MLFKNVYFDLNYKIANGFYSPGNSLPNENELQQIYGVSRTTIRKAIDQLVSEQKVVRKKGSGLFVRPTISKQNILNMTGIIRPTYLESSDKVKFKDTYLRLVGPYYADILGISANELLYYVSFKTLSSHGKSFEKLLLPLDNFPGFDPACLKVTPIIEVVNSGKFNLENVYQDFQLIEASAESSKQLNLKIGSPIFKITNLFSTADKKNVAIEYRMQDALNTEYSIDFN
ncbi:GntR family transcriptional regulator [Lactobacillus sp. ESL0681]|uniref:GntR family transcriptional regulator n=1 Tax=Lactobacillus sp. ESL0681 TaxID=2983211 RepID=UPI0023F6E2CB|nr:GntR family transcriptional regulator [Lactobacillus sp. ESL0681]WEV40218.1 GntR family transcriptional regulator [Lactobacillus sp. ESL0681]